MKELYISPEAKIVAFAASERLAGLDLNFNDFYNGKLNISLGQTEFDSNTDIPMPKNA